MSETLAMAALPFALADAAMALALPGLARLLLWGVVAGAASMLLYRAVSPQRRLARTRRAAAAARRRLAGHDGDAATLGRLVRRSLGLSLTHLRLAIGPTMLAGLPVLAVAAWIGQAYAPAAGAGFLAHWAWPFFGAVLAASLALKSALRIA
ncbi:MAG: hypothetical protein RID91_10500 [Azospirillaceae bacterium]